ncbi:uncharacterized protein LOC143444335 [Clavelina lepadiformis]|uniref:uncharacterized protein LOC143444335 n=1 Tax=Clavelina lepadiformis TaxID=159417 RepID=UPI0040428E2A
MKTVIAFTADDHCDGITGSLKSDKNLVRTTTSAKSLACKRNEAPNPWKSKQLQLLGWSKFIEEKHVDEQARTKRTEAHRCHRNQHKNLARTSSAPVKIPNKRHDNSHPKKQVGRVNSSGGPGLSPGGTHRITYDRDFLLECRQSPLSLTPPSGLPVIPGATAPPEKRRSKRQNLVKTDSNASTSSVISATSTMSNASEDEHL